MKKFVSIVLTICFLFSFAACGQKETGDAVDVNNMTEFEKRYLTGYEAITGGKQYDAIRTLCDNASYFVPGEDANKGSMPAIFVRINEGSIEKNIEKYDAILHQILEQHPTLLTPDANSVLLVLKDDHEDVLRSLISISDNSATIFYCIRDDDPPNTDLALSYRKAYKEFLSSADRELLEGVIENVELEP